MPNQKTGYETTCFACDDFTGRPTLSLGGVGVLFAAGASLKTGKIVCSINLAIIPTISKSYLEERTEA
ncbi:MAG: hypothetical protein ACK5CY_00665 [Bacteroidia bacterium]